MGEAPREKRASLTLSPTPKFVLYPIIAPREEITEPSEIFKNGSSAQA